MHWIMALLTNQNATFDFTPEVEAIVRDLLTNFAFFPFPHLLYLTRSETGLAPSTSAAMPVQKTLAPHWNRPSAMT